MIQIWEDTSFWADEINTEIYNTSAPYFLNKDEEAEDYEPEIPEFKDELDAYLFMHNELKGRGFRFNKKTREFVRQIWSLNIYDNPIDGDVYEENGILTTKYYFVKK